MIKRDKYLNKIISKQNNGLIKVITGVRRSGKSYLLNYIYKNYLLDHGVNENNIIMLALDEDINIKYRNPILLGEYIREKIINKDEQYYIFLDEIQKVENIQNPYIDNKESLITFVDVLLGLMKIPNCDIYVTGSNSKMLSSDILTEFRDRGDEIRVYPLSFKEFYDYKKIDKSDAYREYITYGGLPLAILKDSHEDKSKYLKDLFNKTYLKDVLERNGIKNNQEEIDELLNIISSSMGSLTNPLKLSNTFKSVRKINITSQTISKYLDYFIDAFILDKVYRYDIKGKKYINTPLKYYYTDVGLRNARLNFRQQEENHIMENVVYNELKLRGFDVDIGVVEYNYKDENGKNKRKQFEVDFIASKYNKKYYIQSALTISNEDQLDQELNSLKRINDSFKKVILVKENIMPWYDNNGILYLGIYDFLLNEDSLDI